MNSKKHLAKKIKSEIDQVEDTESIIGRGRGRGEGSSTDSSSEKSRKKNKTESEEGSNVSIPSDQRQDGRQMLLKNQSVYVTRPQHITQKSVTALGSDVNLYSNYFKMTISPQFQFVLYRVDILPEVDIVKVRRYIIANAISGYVYDGGNLVYLTHRLEQDTMEKIIEANDQKYVVKFRCTDLEIKNTDSMATMVLNCILRNAMRGLNLKLIQRNLFDEAAKVRIPEYRLELWPGYITSIREHERDILVCCEISHKVMRFDTVLNILKDITDDRSCRDWKSTFSKEIIGTVILTRYNNRTYRVDDVRFDVNPQTTFETTNGSISFIDYYKNRYNIEIKDRNQPLLVSNPKARDIRAGRNQPCLLVPELCYTTGLTDAMRNNFQVMKALGEHTRLDPTKRVERLEEFSRRINQTNECIEKLEAFGVGLDRDLMRVSGRVLDQETILFGNNRSVQNDQRADWTPAIRNEMYLNVPLQRWGVVYPARAENDFNAFMKIFEEVARGQRVEMGQPKRIVLPDDRTRTYSENLESFCAKDPKFVMVILPNNNADRYICVKNITYSNRGIPNQVIVQRTIQAKKGSMAGVKSIATKILIQINAKLGGVPWMLKIPLSGLMTIGFDVTHDTNDKTKSFGAFVASMDLRKTVKFFSTIAQHRTGEECSSNMGPHMQKALIAWREEHGNLPDRIVIYRDGVGDGQIQYVHENEVKKIKDVLSAFYLEESKLPKFTFVIVSKRINTRVFNKIGNRRYENPVSGTVCDDTITLPERYDFFLISQTVRQGTVSPTSYNVIHDSSNLPPERMQQLTYKLCHLYYNWSGTTRVPAPVQYAHKLSILVGQYLHKEPNSGLEKSLYYL